MRDLVDYQKLPFPLKELEITTLRVLDMYTASGM
jgi:hypothetical protein